MPTENRSTLIRSIVTESLISMIATVDELTPSAN